MLAHDKTCIEVFVAHLYNRKTDARDYCNTIPRILQEVFEKA